jgi:hypothetical protein
MLAGFILATNHGCARSGHTSSAAAGVVSKHRAGGSMTRSTWLPRWLVALGLVAALLAVLPPASPAHAAEASPGSWLPTAPARALASATTATVLADGRVVVTSYAGECTQAAELYDPATDSWQVIGPIPSPRPGQYIVAALHDGRVLIAGGDQERRPGTTVTAEIYATTPLPPRCFTATGQCIAGRFLTYWLAYGGLAVNGYPLTGEFTQTLEDGHTYTVQYFERARFEQHPENQPPYDILLGQFGRRILAGVAPPPPPPLTVVNGFGALYNTNAAVRERLGRPTTNERAVPGRSSPSSAATWSISAIRRRFSCWANGPTARAAKATGYGHRIRGRTTSRPAAVPVHSPASTSRNGASANSGARTTIPCRPDSATPPRRPSRR